MIQKRKIYNIVLSNPKSQKNDKPEETIPYQSPLVKNNKKRKEQIVLNQLYLFLKYLKKNKWKSHALFVRKKSDKN